MDPSSAEMLVGFLKIYGGLGVLVALPFALWLAPRIDAGARGSSIAFRLMLVPGAALLWPLVLARAIAALRARRPEVHP